MLVLNIKLTQGKHIFKTQEHKIWQLPVTFVDKRCYESELKDLCLNNNPKNEGKKTNTSIL